MDSPDFVESTQLLEDPQSLIEHWEQPADKENETKILGILLVGSERHNIIKGTTRIGRDPQCDIFINNPSVSKVHAVIDGADDGITIQDEKSSNGTRKDKMLLKSEVRYILMNGEKLAFGNVVAEFLLNDKEEDEKSSNASETLLGDFEDDADAENVPPNFVPDTPIVVKPTWREKHHLPETSFQPESQSSPLPSSTIAILKTAHFQVPESPSSDLNDSSFIAASQQTSSGKFGSSMIITETAAPAASQTVDDTLDSESDETAELMPPNLSKVDTNKLNNLIASARGEKEVSEDASSSIFTMETQNILDNSCDDSSLLMAETQPVENSAPVSSACTSQLTENTIRSKLTDSEIIGASTQYLLDKLTDVEDETSDSQDSLSDFVPSITSDDEMILTTETQPIFRPCSLSSIGELESESDGRGLEEADTLIIEGSDEEERENGNKTVVKWFEKIGDTTGDRVSSTESNNWSDPKMVDESNDEDLSNFSRDLIISADQQSMIESSQTSIIRTETGRNKTDVNIITMDQTTAVDSEILVADNIGALADQSQPNPSGQTSTSIDVNESEETTNKSLCLQLNATVESPSLKVSSEGKSEEEKTPEDYSNCRAKIKVVRRRNSSILKSSPNNSKESITSPISSVKAHLDYSEATKEKVMEDDEDLLPLTQELTIEDEELDLYSDDVSNSTKRDSTTKNQENVKEKKQIKLIQKKEKKKGSLGNATETITESSNGNCSEISGDSSLSKESRKNRAKKKLNPDEWVVQNKRKPALTIKTGGSEAITPRSKKGFREEKVRSNSVIRESSPSSKVTVTVAEALKSMMRNNSNERESDSSSKEIICRKQPSSSQKSSMGKITPRKSIRGRVKGEGPQDVPTKEVSSHAKVKPVTVESSENKEAEKDVDETKINPTVTKRGRGRPRKTEPIVSFLPSCPPDKSNATAPSKSRGKKRTADVTPEISSNNKRKNVESSNSGSGGRRSRQLNSSNDACSSPTLRKIDNNKRKFHVMFTGYNASASDLELISQLQGSVTGSVTDCTVLVTDKVKRTAKFLSMIAKGVPIVSHAWLTESRKLFRFMEPWNFILNDSDSEKKWGFKLKETLKKAQERPLLEGLKIHVTEGVQPSPEMCKDIIECGGGTFLERLPSAASPDLYVVSCQEDRKMTESSARAGLPIMNKEWLLSGLLKYKLDRKLKL